MKWLSATTLFEGSLLVVGDVRCHAPRSDFGAEERGSLTEVLLPTAGMFVISREGSEVVADRTRAVVLPAGKSYRVKHPVEGGDRCTVFVLRRHDVAEELLHGSRDAGPLPVQVQLAVHLLTATLRREVVDELETDETVAAVFASVTSALADNQSGRPSSQRLGARRAADIEARLISAPGTRWNLEELANALHCSPFHLARQFRAATGESIAAYLTRLRVGIAIERLAAGESDLARLAADLGFSSHSHFSARFRSLVGVPPSSVRDQLRGPTLAEVRTNLTARAPKPS